VVQPDYDEHGHITGAHTVHAIPGDIAEITAETAEIKAQAHTVGGQVAEIINTLQEQNREFQRELQEQQRDFQRQLQQDVLRAAQQNTEATRLRGQPPELKVEPPKYYEGEATEIDAWLRRMVYYFGQVRITDEQERIAYAIQRIRKGKNNKAQNWSNSKINQMALYGEELAQFNMDYPGRNPTIQQIATVCPEIPAHGIYLDWPEYIFIHKIPFVGWAAFAEEARRYFLTTETREKAIKSLQDLKQTGKSVEEYITEFEGWLLLASFDEIALVDQFKRGLEPHIGRRILEMGSPGDGSVEGDLRRWFAQAQQLEKDYCDSDNFYGKRQFFFEKKKQDSPKASTSKVEHVTVKVKDNDDKMDVDQQKTTCPPPKCYNCGKMGHIARNCCAPKQIRKIDIREVMAAMTEEDKEAMKKELGFPPAQ
jgi:hypothetical protein